VSPVIEKCAYDDVNNRQLFMLELSSPREIPQHIDLGSPHFGCLIVWDASKNKVEDVAALVDPLIKAGCVYFVCWGSNCEWVHDTIDEFDPYFESTGAVVMTTWHDKEPLEETTWFFLNSMWPDSAFERSFDASIAVVIDSDGWANPIRSALREPRIFSNAGLDREQETALRQPNSSDCRSLNADFRDMVK
jgi:hypothetical protein